MSRPRSFDLRLPLAATVAAIGTLSATVGCGHATRQACKDPSEPAEQEWVVDGTINSVAVVCGTVYVGGAFHSIGPPTGAAAVVDAGTGTRLRFPLVDGEVRAVTDDGRGGWFIGGQLKTVGGEPCPGLAHVARGVLDWCPPRVGRVSALARDGRKLYVAYGANFTVPARLASFDIRSRPRRMWALKLGKRRPPPCEDEEEFCGPSSSISALVARRGAVYIGGFFSSASHRAFHDLAAINGTTGRPLPFDAALTTNKGPAATDVTALALAGNTLYVGGRFDRIGGAPRRDLAAVDARSGATTSWAPRVVPSSGMQATVSAIATTRNRVVIGGSFRRVNGVRRRGFAVLTASSARLLPTQFPSQAQRHPVPVVALAVNDANVYLSGDGYEGNVESTYTAAVDTRTGRASNWNPSANGPVYAIAAAGRRVLLGGAFSSVNAVARDGLAAIDGPRKRLRRWQPRLIGLTPADPGVVNVLLPRDDRLYVGGAFTSVAGRPRSLVAAFSLPALQLLSWHPRVSGEAIFDGVRALAADDGALYVAGDFDHINGAERKEVGAISEASGQTLPWKPPPVYTGIANAIAVHGNFVFVGGNPSTGSIALAAFEKKKAAFADWNGEIDFGGDVVPDVSALAVAGGSLYAAGIDLPDSGLARMDLDKGDPLPLALHPTSEYPTDAVHGMVVVRDNVYVLLPRPRRIAVIRAQSGTVQRWVRVCAASDETTAVLAATDAHVIVNCTALGGDLGGGGGGERLVVERVSGR